MDVLSYLRRTAIYQLDKLYSNLLPIQCLLCGIKCTRHCLCNDCINDLPSLTTYCQRCAMPLQLGTICGKCLTNPPLQIASVCLYPYHPTIKRLIADLKYHHTLPLIDFFADEMAEKLQSRDDLPQAIIPIPLHPTRLRHRGYNQAVELGRSLSKKLAIPMLSTSLTRIRNTTPQAKLVYAERKQNMANAFAIKKANLPQHVALIDDVFTTGQTLNAAARILKKAGVKNIEFWAIARTHHTVI